MPTYLLKRRQGWSFVITVPVALRGQFGVAKGTGRPRAQIVEGLGTQAIAEARKRAAIKLGEWTLRFQRAREQTSISVDEIEAEAHEFYQFWTDRLKANAQLGKYKGEPIELDGEVLTVEEAALGVLNDDVIEALKDNEWGAVAPEIAAIERKKGVTVPRESPTYGHLANALLEAKLNAIGDRDRALRGQAPATVWRAPVPVIAQPKARAGSASDRRTFLEMSELCLADWDRDPATRLRRQTLHQHRAVYHLFADAAGNRPLASITRGEASKFLANTAEQRGISNRTINQYAASLGAIWKWAHRNGQYDGVNVWEDQARLPKGGTFGWLPFNADEIAKLVILPPGDDVLAWAMLIALYSGQRINEICGLWTTDLKQQDGVWFFDLHEQHRKLKNTSAIRRVPIHSELIRLGLLEYASKRPPGLLFSLEAAGPDGKYSKSVSQKFMRHRRKCGVDRPRVSLHSTRVSFVTKLDEAHAEPTDISAVVGHYRNFTLNTYSGGMGLKRLQEIVERVSYPGL